MILLPSGGPQFPANSNSDVSAEKWPLLITFEQGIFPATLYGRRCRHPKSIRKRRKSRALGVLSEVEKRETMVQMKDTVKVEAPKADDFKGISCLMPNVKVNLR